MNTFYLKLRTNRLLNLFVVNLRYIIGLGFIPSGIKKILNHPFTNPANEGIFFDYLDALYTTGIYYNMIGYAQVTAAILLMTQRYSTLGAIMFLPIIFNITVLTLSTIGSLTPLIATLMFLGICFLLLWDYYKWINIIQPDNVLFDIPGKNHLPTYNTVNIFTGVFLVTVPVILTALKLPSAGIISVPIILLLGNSISEYKYPLLRKVFRRDYYFQV